MLIEASMGWANRNFNQLNKRKCKVLCLGRNNFTHQYVLGTDWLESKFAEKVLVYNKVTLKIILSQKCSPVAKKAPTILGCIKNRIVSRLRGMILPLYLALVRLHLQCCVRFGAPQHKRDRCTAVSPAWGHEGLLKAWDIRGVWRGWESWDCSPWSREGSSRLLSMHPNTHQEGEKKTEPDSAQQCPVTKQEAMRTKGNTGNSL